MLPRLRSFSGLLVCAAAACSASAQNTSGSIVGQVTDPSGAAVPGASVLIVDKDTNDSRRLTTDDQGGYTATLLKPGTYVVTVSSAAFKANVASGVVLQVAQTVRVDAHLQLGAVSDVVNVDSSSVSLDTDAAAEQQTLDETQITQLPLNGRNFFDLLFLTPGAVEQGGGEQAGFRYDAGNAISLGGARSSSNGYTVDGTSIMDYSYNTPAYNISLDAIQEMKIQTKSYSAEYGFSMNQVNISSKSGTKGFHGSVYEYIRNDYLDAKDPFVLKGLNQPLRQNQFGYSLGGPVFVPGLLPNRDKTYFFANYEGQRIRSTTALQGFVPTANELNGIFPFTIYDPQTGLPFANNTIPSDRFSRIGKLIQSEPTLFFPVANVANAAAGANNYSTAGSNQVNVDQQNYRIDHRFSDRDSFFIRAALSNISVVTPAIAVVSTSTHKQTARNYTFVYTHAFTPTFLNQFRAGYLEAQSVINPYPLSPTDATALGYSNAYQLPNGGYPNIAFQSYTSPNASRPTNTNYAYAGTGGMNSTPTGSVQPLYDFSDGLSTTKGQHTINFGGDFRHIELELKNTTNPLGVINYDGEFSGNQIADLLLGTAHSVLYPQVGTLSNIQLGNAPHLHFEDFAAYVQDDWKAASRLTLNLGLRYEFQFAPTEEQNQLAWFDPNITGGGLYVANQNIVTTYGNGFYAYPGTRGPGPAPRNGLEPRFGFAFRPTADDKTVIRGGYGLFSDTTQLQEYQASTNFFPYAVQGSINASLGQPLLLTDNFFAPTAALGKVTSANLSFLQIGASKVKNPYIQTFNLSVERQITPTTIVEVNYEGNKGTRLFNRTAINQPTQCILANGCNPDTTSAGYIPVQARRPFQNLGTTVYEGWDGYSNYNAGNVIVTQHAKDLTLLATYTWAKGLDIKSATSAVNGDAAGWLGPQDSHNPSADYARSSYDVGQRLSVSFVAGLPVGRGHRFGTNMNHGLDAVVGGWQVSGIVLFQGGFPFTVTANDTGFVNEAYSERANLVGNPFPSGFRKSRTEWFNTAAFAQPAPGAYGNSSRNVIRQPGEDLWNLTAAKSFHLTERARLQFRFESFNVFNHAQLGLPNANVNSGVIFGTITSLQSGTNPRQNQGVLRLEF